MRLNVTRQRIVIGALGMLLSVIVVALIGYIPNSISATWYTNACTPFMIILGWASGQLICYKGYEFIDDLILTLAGIAGFGICLFPCAIDNSAENVGTFLVNKGISNSIHMICAVIFFALLAYNSIFLFTKSSGEMTKQKKIRNIIYIVCGIGMLASFSILLLPYFRIQVWLTETIALAFFGISFLTKADITPWIRDKEVKE